MAADYAHSADAVVNRGHKAGKLYMRMCHDGLLQLPPYAAAREAIRRAAGLPRPPSEETWDLAGRMLAAWPPALAPPAARVGTTAVCGCTVDEDGLLYEHLPADRDAAGVRFEGWLCPHNCPVYLGEPREVSRIPTVDDGQRAAYALEAVTYAQETPPPPPPAAGPPVRQPDSLPGRARREDGPSVDRETAPADGPAGTPGVLLPEVPGVAPDQPAAAARPRRFGQCDDSCTTVDCGHCKGDGPPPVNPHRITVALDRAGLQGPTADAKLGAVEPDLDNWEAGRTHPTAAQLRRLAGMANVDVGFFYLPDDAEPRLTLARVHLGGRKGCQTVITMLGEPADPPQATLAGDPDWWDA